MAKCPKCNRPGAFVCESCGRSVQPVGVGGVVPPSALGPSPSSTKFLRGDGTWQTVEGGGGGGPSMVMGYNWDGTKLYYEGFEKPYVWIPTDLHLYVDVETGEMFLE